MSDPIQRLEHDHVPLRRLADELSLRLREARLGPRPVDEVHGDFSEVLDELREELLHHFAMEDEGLFPLLLRELPELAEAVGAVQKSHDSLCGLAARLTHLSRRGPSAFAEQLAQAELLTQRFEAEYGRHADEERSLLRQADAAMTPRQKEELSKALEGL